MKNLLYLFGPTMMIYIGLSHFRSIPITFTLFYGWLLLIPLATYYKNSRLRDMFILSFQKGFTSKSLIIGLITGAISLIAIFSSVYLLQGFLFDVDRLSEVLVEWGFSGINVWSFIVVLILINPFLEEWYWREFMHVRLMPSLGGKRTVLVTSFFYALYHLLSLIPMFVFPFNLIAAIPVFGAGLLWGYFRLKFSSILPSILSHVLADIGIIFVYLYYIM